MAMRKARNACRTYMTNNTKSIGVVGQMFWWWFSMPPSLLPYIVEVRGEIIGYAIIKRSGLRAWLTAGLLPESRGKGYGTEVFFQLSQVSKLMDLVPSLEVRESNAPAIAVYGKLGFVKTASDGVVMRMVMR